MKKFTLFLVPLMAVVFLANCGGAKEYTITWKNDDGSVLSTTKVKENEKPSYDKENPVKPSTEEFEYTFSAWQPEIVKATCDATYTATYTSITREYEVTFNPNGGVWLDGTSAPKIKKIKYGKMPTCDDVPFKSSTDEYDYVFSGWPSNKVTGPTTCMANFEELKKDVTNLVVDFPNDATDRTITFNYGGKIDNVDWGDGTSNDTSTHTYRQNGCYKININGQITSLSLSTNLGTISKGNKYIKIVKLSDGINNIDFNAFYKCSSLVSAIIPNSVTFIGGEAFSNCSSLIYISIPSSVALIDSYTFDDCRSLIAVKLHSGLTSIDNDAFLDCSSLISINIPNSVTFIDVGAFGCCSSLTSIKVENDNQYFDNRNDCNAIITKQDIRNEDGKVVYKKDALICGCKNTIIPDGVVSIADRAFWGCSDLQSITIPSSVTSIGTLYVFGGCYSLASIVVSEDNPNFDSRNNCNAIIRKSNNTLILGCKNTIIPDGVVSLGISSFDGCLSLTSINIPASVTLIDSFAFNGCSSLVSIYIPINVATIEIEVFNYCSGLKAINCQVSKQPDSWSRDWCGNVDRSIIHWGVPPTNNA